MIFFQDELMQNWELAKDMKLGLYVSGFWHNHAKTPRGTVVCEQQHIFNKISQKNINTTCVFE